MSMCNILCVTNRHLVKGDFLEQLEKIAASGVQGVILREKDLEETTYRNLAEKVQPICEAYSISFFIHTYWKTAQAMGIQKIHLPYPVFVAMEPKERERFSVIGVSIHSLEEALHAQNMGSSYITAGHIFATDCKKGVPPRGVSFLQEICQKTTLPVYAIGGVVPQRVQSCIEAGAKGICLMSSLMQAEEPAAFLQSFKIIHKPEFEAENHRDDSSGDGL